LDALDADDDAALRALAEQGVLTRLDPERLDRFAPVDRDAFADGDGTGSSSSSDSTQVPQHQAWRDEAAPTDPQLAGATSAPTEQSELWSDSESGTEVPADSTPPELPTPITGA